MWFTEIAGVNSPGQKELGDFVTSVEKFLWFVIERREDFSFLWEDDETLFDLALETMQRDVREEVSILRSAIPEISENQLLRHGLIGRPMRFKLRVLDTIGKRWESVRGHFSIRDWFKRIIGAIDAILDSLVNAAGGAGGLIKEFKDSLASLAKTI